MKILSHFEAGTKPRPCAVNETIQSNFDEVMILLSFSTEKEVLSI